MAEMKRRLVERVAEPSYIEGLDARALEDLEAMRIEVSLLENDLSFERRLCQARIDILSAELDHRTGKVEGDLISRLPQILADESKHTHPRPPSDQTLPSRAPDVRVPRIADVPRRRLEEIVGGQTLARLTTMPEEEIKTSISALVEYERTLSGRRKRVHEVLDAIQGELVRRYSTGEADASLPG